MANKFTRINFKRVLNILAWKRNSEVSYSSNDEKKKIENLHLWQWYYNNFLKKDQKKEK